MIPDPTAVLAATTSGGLLLVLAVLMPFVGVLAGLVFGGRYAQRVAVVDPVALPAEHAAVDAESPL